MNIKLFNFFRKKDNKVVKDITLGRVNDMGYCDVYANGKKTNVRMLTFTNEEFERLRKISEELHKNDKNEFSKI